MRINAAHLTTSGSGADLTISALMPAAWSTARSAYPMGLAFDAAGNLWVNYDGTIAELPASVLGGTGTITVTPPVQLETDVAALPEGIAFDEQGGLWFAYSAGRIARFAPTPARRSGPGHARDHHHQQRHRRRQRRMVRVLPGPGVHAARPRAALSVAAGRVRAWKDAPAAGASIAWLGAA